MQDKKYFVIALALLVTFLWSTSFVIIKIGLNNIPPLTFAGLRYFLASLTLLPLLFSKKNKSSLAKITRRQFLQLFLLGILFYSLTQGAQFIGLSLLPAVTVSLWLNFTPFVVAFSGMIFINEYPTKMQWIGVIFFICGVMIYFLPVSISENQVWGLSVMTLGVLANAASSVLGRKINKTGNLPVIVITVVSMGFGSILLLATGITTESFPQITGESILYLLWLAVINTALAFTIWNYTLKYLTAMESCIINGTMLIQIALLAWIFLNEQISSKEVTGMIIAALGAVLVQIKFSRKSHPETKK